jgi:hypothetical protein
MQRLRHVIAGHCDARHVAVVRVLTMVVWLHELVRMGPFVRLYYDPPVGSAGAWYAGWVVATLAVLVGYRARAFAAAGLVVTFVLVTLDHVIYHVDYYVLLTFFYFTFIETDRAWSLRAYLARRRGAPLAPRVWSGPVHAMASHLAFIYLNAGLAHVLYNASWREGYALAQAFANPIWRSPAGEFVGRLGLPTWPLDYGTMAFELAFAPLWIWAMLRPPAVRIRTALGALAIAFHVGIAWFLDIGAFSHFVIATACVFLPSSLFFGDAAPPAAPDPELTRGRRAILAGLGAVVALAAVVQPPLDLLGRRVKAVGAAYRAGVTALSRLGDQRPHDVFSEPATESVYYVVTSFHGGGRREVWPLLYDEQGERVGYGTDMRMFMSARRPLRSIGQRVLDGQGAPDRHVAQLLGLVEPLLRADLELSRNAWVRSVRVEFRGHRLGRSSGDPFVAGPAGAPLSCFEVARAPAVILSGTACR